MNLDAIREKLGYQPVLLGVVALVVSGALALAATSTHDAIAAAEAADLRNSLSDVLPKGFADNDLVKDVVTLQYKDKPLTIYRARLGSALKGVVFQVSERGYSGEILVLMAVDVDGKMLGARVLKHTETPGLGDKIEIAKDKWILSFNGKSLGEPPADKWGVKKDGGVFDQFAGATITPRAVVKAVKGGLEFYAEHRQEILGGQS